MRDVVGGTSGTTHIFCNLSPSRTEKEPFEPATKHILKVRHFFFPEFGRKTKKLHHEVRCSCIPRSICCFGFSRRLLLASRLRVVSRVVLHRDQRRRCLQHRTPESAHPFLAVSLSTFFHFRISEAGCASRSGTMLCGNAHSSIASEHDFVHLPTPQSALADKMNITLSARQRYREKSLGAISFRTFQYIHLRFAHVYIWSDAFAVFCCCSPVHLRTWRHDLGVLAKPGSPESGRGVVFLPRKK